MTFKQLTKCIGADFKEHGGRSKLKCIYIYFFDAKFRLLLNYRLGRYFVESSFKPFKILAAYYKYRQITKRGCQVSFYAKLGQGVVFKHPLGIVIGDNVVVGNNVKIWQQVTLGSHGKEDSLQDYPVVEDNVKIFAGAKIFGGIVIGNSAVIAANAVVNKSVLPNDIVAGIPAVSIKKNKV